MALRSFIGIRTKRGNPKGFGVRCECEHLVQNDDGGIRRGLRSHDISAKRAVPAFYGDAILHCVLLRRRRFIWASANIVAIDGGPLASEPVSAWRPRAGLTKP